MEAEMKLSPTWTTAEDISSVSFYKERDGRITKTDIAGDYSQDEIDEYGLTPVHLSLTNKKDDLWVGGYCMFYNSISKVLEINGGSAKIESLVVQSKEDADMMNDMNRDKENYTPSKVGKISKMIHSFSISQMRKVVASTDTTFGLPLIPKETANLYHASIWGDDPIEFMKIEANQDTHHTVGMKIEKLDEPNVFPKLNNDGYVIITEVIEKEKKSKIDEIMDNLSGYIELGSVHSMKDIQERFGIDTGLLKGSLTQMDWGMKYSRTDLKKIKK